MTGVEISPPATAAFSTTPFPVSLPSFAMPVILSEMGDLVLLCERLKWLMRKLEVDTEGENSNIPEASML